MCNFYRNLPHTLGNRILTSTKDCENWKDFNHITKSVMMESEMRSRMSEEKNGKKRKKSRPWPWWVVIIAWILVFLTVSLGGFFTLLYSFEWGGDKSAAWLTAFVLSFFQSVMIIQPIKVSFHNLRYQENSC